MADSRRVKCGEAAWPCVCLFAQALLFSPSGFNDISLLQEKKQQEKKQQEQQEQQMQLIQLMQQMQLMQQEQQERRMQQEKQEQRMQQEQQEKQERRMQHIINLMKLKILIENKCFHKRHGMSLADGIKYHLEVVLTDLDNPVIWRKLSNNSKSEKYIVKDRNAIVPLLQECSINKILYKQLLRKTGEKVFGMYICSE